MKFAKRYVIVAMVFVGYTIFFAIHANVGMAVVSMTSSKDTEGPNGTITVPPQFEWDSMQRAVVISSFSYGRLMGTSSAVFVGRIGGSTSYLLGLVTTATVVFCMPYMLRVNFWLFVLGNALTGSFEGISYTSVPQIWSRWAPPNERAKMVATSVTGIYSGQVLSFVVAGWILYEWGWAALFHITGTATFVWAIVWFIVVKNDPADDKWISVDERKYIKEQIESKSDDNSKLEYPWKDMLTCLPFWITCLGKFTYGFGVTFMMMYLPQYVKDTNEHVDIKQIGYISMVPQICAALSNPPAGLVFDYLRSHKILSLTNIHKLYACIGLLTGTLMFGVICSWSNFTASVICMCVFQVFMACTILQNQIVVLDLAPRYAAFMASVAMFCYNSACIFTPLLIGLIVTSHSRLQWITCFIVFGAVFTGTSFIYLKFLKVKLQHWADYSRDADLNEMKNRLAEVPLTIN